MANTGNSEGEFETTVPETTEEALTTTRSGRVSRPPVRLDDYVVYGAAIDELEQQLYIEEDATSALDNS